VIVGSFAIKIRQAVDFGSSTLTVVPIVTTSPRASRFAAVLRIDIRLPPALLEVPVRLR